jgi:uncharacterized protein (DUF58 family)
MQTTHVRETIADRELELWMLIDQSASLDFGTANHEKRDLALEAAGAVGFLTARSGNRLGGMLLRPGGRNVIVPARSGRTHLQALLARVMDAPRIDGAGPTDLGAGMYQLAAGMRRRGLAVVISDFLDGDSLTGPFGWESALRRLAVRHDVLAVEVIDPRELELPPVGVLQVVDAETGALREVQTADPRLRARYAAAAASQRAAIDTAIQGSGADHLVLRTDRDWLLDLARFVLLRRKRFESVPPRAGR